jgi:hypothetical protein
MSVQGTYVWAFLALALIPIDACVFLQIFG